MTAKTIHDSSSARAAEIVREYGPSRAPPRCTA